MFRIKFLSHSQTALSLLLLACFALCGCGDSFEEVESFSGGEMVAPPGAASAIASYRFSFSNPASGVSLPSTLAPGGQSTAEAFFIPTAQPYKAFRGRVSSLEGAVRRGVVLQLQAEGGLRQGLTLTPGTGAVLTYLEADTVQPRNSRIFQAVSGSIQIRSITSDSITLSVQNVVLSLPNISRAMTLNGDITLTGVPNLPK